MKPGVFACGENKVATEHRSTEKELSRKPLCTLLFLLGKSCLVKKFCQVNPSVFLKKSWLKLNWWKTSLCVSVPLWQIKVTKQPYKMC
jgi:hypothetical protein